MTHPATNHAQVLQQTKLFSQFFKFVAYGVLAITWSVLALFLLVITEGWLAPWDTSRFKPPAGSWAYVLNHFFQSGIGSILPTLLIVGSSVLLYTYGVQRIGQKRTPEKTSLTLQFALANFVFLLFLVLFVPFLARIISNSQLILTPSDVIGYQHTWPKIVMGGIGGLGLIAFQLAIVGRGLK